MRASGYKTEPEFLGASSFRLCHSKLNQPYAQVLTMRSTLPRFTISSLYRLETDDAELARAQFRTFSKQMPLLYCILVFNAGAIMWDFYNPEKLFETFLFPLAMCAVALVRSFWWFRQGDGSHFSDKEIAHYITRTCGLAVIMTFSFELWCMWI